MRLFLRKVLYMRCITSWSEDPDLPRKTVGPGRTSPELAATTPALSVTT